MDSLVINTGEKRIAINNDESRVIVFNPHDVIFAEKFYNLIGEFQAKVKEYEPRAKAIDEDNSVDDLGIPANTPERLELLREICTFMRDRIDHLFGMGASQKAFGDTLSLDVFEQFFTGIKPIVQSARTAKVQKYTNKKEKRNE